MMYVTIYTKSRCILTWESAK